MTSSRASKILLSILVVVGYLCTLFMGLSALLYLIGSWIIWVLASVAVVVLSLLVYILLNWIWKERMDGANGSLNEEGDATCRKIFLTIWALELFSLLMFIAFVLVVSFTSIWLIIIVSIGMFYGLYRIVKLIWKGKEIVSMDNGNVDQEL